MPTLFKSVAKFEERIVFDDLFALFLSCRALLRYEPLFERIGGCFDYIVSQQIIIIAGMCPDCLVPCLNSGHYMHFHS